MARDGNVTTGRLNLLYPHEQLVSKKGCKGRTRDVAVQSPSPPSSPRRDVDSQASLDVHGRSWNRKRRQRASEHRRCSAASGSWVQAGSFQKLPALSSEIALHTDDVE